MNPKRSKKLAIKEQGESHSRFLIDIIIKTGTNVAAISGIYSMHALFDFKTYFNEKIFILQIQYCSNLISFYPYFSDPILILILPQKCSGG